MKTASKIENFLITFFYMLGITGFILIRMSRFHPTPQIIISFLATLILSYAWNHISAESTHEAKEKEHTPWWTACILAIFSIAIFHSLFPACYMLGDRDPGLYLLFSAVISKTGSLNLDLTQAGKAVTDLKDLAQPGYPGIYDAVKLGFSETPGELHPQFAHLFCSYGALFHRLFGIEGLIRTNAFIGLFAMLSFAKVLKKILPGWFVLAGIILLGLNPAFMWNSRQTLTETLSIFILFSSMLLLLNSDKKHQGIILFAAGTVMASGILNRVDTLFNSILVAAFIITASINKTRKTILWLPVAFILVSVIGLADGLTFAGPYYQHLWKSGTLQMLIALYAIIIPFAIVVFFVATKDLTIPKPWISRSITAGAILLGLWVCIRYFPGDTHPSESAKRAVQELGWYIFPLSYPIIIIGLHFAARDKNAKAWIPIATICGFAMFAFTWKPYAWPDHFWASRRWLTQVIPFGIIITLYMLNKMQVSLGEKRKTLGTCIILVSITCIITNSIYVSRTFVTEHLLQNYETDLNKISTVLNDTPYGDYLVSNAPELASYMTYIYDHPTILLSKKGKRILSGEKDNDLLNNLYFIGTPFPALAHSLDTEQHFLVKGKFPEHAVARIPEKLDNRVCYYELGRIKSGNTLLKPHNIIAMDSRLLTTPAGIKDYSNEKIVSTGKAGFLQYGPYIHLNAGRYKVSWHGTINTTSSDEYCYVDVTLESGKTTATKITFSPNENSEGILAEAVFALDKPVNGVEFRLYMNEGSSAQLEKITLTRVDP